MHSPSIPLKLMFNSSSGSGVKLAALFAVLSGIVFAFLTPLSALFLEGAEPIFTVAALNLGAGIGMAVLLFFSRKTKLAVRSEKITRKDMPILAGIVIGDLLGALFSMLSLTFAAADSVSLVLNFEIVSTALIAFCFFREKVSKRLGIAIVLITLGCIAITAGDLEKFIASPGILLALASCLCWGITHNLYRKISYQNPHGILTIRGLGIGLISLVLSLLFGEGIPAVSLIIVIMLIGFATYGLGNVFFVLAQRKLGAAKVSAISGFSPFLAAFISLLIFQESPTVSFIVALLLLIPGVYLSLSEGMIHDSSLPPAADERKETPDIRNTLSAVGYFIMGGSLLYYALLLLNISFAVSPAENTLMLGSLCCSGFLLLIGTMLIILRKRDFDGITFIVYALILALVAICHTSPFLIVSLGIMELILGGIFLLSREKKKYSITILFVLLGLVLITNQTSPEMVTIICAFAASGMLFITGLLSTGLFPSLRLTKMLNADDHTNFRQNGAMIGYLIFAVTMIPWIGLYLTGTSVLTPDAQNQLVIVSVIALLLIGVLMIFVGKSWFTGAIFIGLAFVQALSLTADGVVYFVIGIIIILFGILSLLRKPAYLLSGMMYIIYGISAVSSEYVSGTIQIQFVQLLLNIIPCLIAIYLAAAVFSRKKKLPLF